MNVSIPSLSVSSETVKTARDVAIAVATTAATVAAVVLPIIKFLSPALLVGIPWLWPVAIGLAVMSLTYDAYCLHEYLDVKDRAKDAKDRPKVEAVEAKIEITLDSLVMDEIPNEREIKIIENLQEPKPTGAGSGNELNVIRETISLEQRDEIKEALSEWLKAHENHMGKQRICDAKIEELEEKIESQRDSIEVCKKLSEEKKQIKNEFQKETDVFNQQLREKKEQYPVLQRLHDIAMERISAKVQKQISAEGCTDYDAEGLRLVLIEMDNWIEHAGGEIYDRFGYEEKRNENAGTPAPTSPEPVLESIVYRKITLT